jgi:hypothetical protein
LTEAFLSSGNSSREIEALVENVMGKKEVITFSEFMDFVQVLENRQIFDSLMTVDDVDRSGGGL